mmetsp:Transcript_21429/g.53827  ORF Transcript_21429/g.53827 Transcript_21429/m.53827 type:complete len:251 (-) Transcript_21429:638-1390(-)
MQLTLHLAPVDLVFILFLLLPLRCSTSLGTRLLLLLDRNHLFSDHSREERLLHPLKLGQKLDTDGPPPVEGLLDDALEINGLLPEGYDGLAHPQVLAELDEKGFDHVCCSMKEALPCLLSQLGHRELQPRQHSLVRNAVPDHEAPPMPLNQQCSELEPHPRQINRLPHLLTRPRGEDCHAPLGLRLDLPQVARVLVPQPLLHLLIPLQHGGPDVVAPLHLHRPDLLHYPLHRLHLEHTLPNRLGHLHSRV